MSGVRKATISSHRPIAIKGLTSGTKRWHFVLALCPVPLPLRPSGLSPLQPLSAVSASTLKTFVHLHSFRSSLDFSRSYRIKELRSSPKYLNNVYLKGFSVWVLTEDLRFCPQWSFPDGFAFASLSSRATQ